MRDQTHGIKKNLAPSLLSPEITLGGFLVTLWKWGQEKGMCAAGAFPPERISKVNEKKGKLPVLAFLPDEARTLIKEIKEEFLPWLILCGWNGLRAEEVAPKPHDTKRALMWEDIIFDKGIIVVPAETAKTGRKRVIPLSDVSRKYLSGITNQKGRIVISNPSGGGYSETKRIGELIGGWKKNGLRNSYISYRACLIGIAKTAMESGNSEAVCKSNYLDATTEEMSKERFSL